MKTCRLILEITEDDGTVKSEGTLIPLNIFETSDNFGMPIFDMVVKGLYKNLNKIPLTEKEKLFIMNPKGDQAIYQNEKLVYKNNPEIEIKNGDKFFILDDKLPTGQSCPVSYYLDGNLYNKEQYKIITLSNSLDKLK